MEHKEINLSDESAQDISCAAQVVNRTLDTAIDLLGDIQKIFSPGKPKILRVKFGDRTVAEVPLAITAAALATGLAAVLLMKLAVEVVTED